MFATLRQCLQPSRVSRRVTALAASVVVLIALVGLTFSAPSLVRPQTASAQTICNGVYDPYNMGCSSTNMNYCNGSYNAYGTGCSLMASNCSGLNYAYGANCSTAAYYGCNSVGYSSSVGCPTLASSYSCNGVGYSYSVSCPVTASSYACNGVGYSYAVSCPTMANSYSCNGVGYSSPVSCLATTGTACGNGVVVYAGQSCPATYTNCANGQQVLVSQQCPASIVVASAIPLGSINTTSSYFAPQGFSVSYAAGWNIVAGPTGSTLTGTIGPLYTYRPGDTAYEASASGMPLQAGAGSWAYFGANTTTTIDLANPSSMSVQLPADQYVMIGNAGNTTATVSGADMVLVYNPSTGGYNQTTQLSAGQGAWAISLNGGQATLTNSPI